MEGEEIEDRKSREDQKFQMLLVKSFWAPCSGGFLSRLGAWQVRRGKLFSFTSLCGHKGIWGQGFGIPEHHSWKWF